MSAIEIVITAERMGRPPLGLKATQVRLPEGMAGRIDALVGTQRRAQFIREAIEAELERREKSGGAEKPEGS